MPTGIFKTPPFDNGTTGGGDGGSGGRGEIWVISFESDPAGGSAGTTGYGMML